MEPFILEEEQYLQLSSWKRLSKNLVAGFTTRNGGVSTGYYSSLNGGLHVADRDENVIENRRILSKRIDFPLHDWVIAEQVHGASIAMVTSKDKGSGVTTLESSLHGMDGMVTSEKGILLTAFFADCIPLYFFDPIREVIGIAHAGWKGTVKEIAGNMITTFKDYGSLPEDIHVAIGPGISKEHYEVDEYVASKIDEPFRSRVLTNLGNSRYLLDLKALNREILLQYGILRHNIDMTTYCTYQEKEMFFSHRRDQGKTGRMLGYIGMRKE